MYEYFADVYDSLIEDADTNKRADFICSLFESYDKMPSLLLDNACGSGNFSRYFAKKGVSVIGTDLSTAMLNVAREKSSGLDILYLNQDMCELDLYGTVDGAICMLDSLNHLKSYEDFCTALQKTALFLEKDRLFIFDVNTPYKHKFVLGNNTFIKENKGVFCAWQNFYEENDNRVDITLDFFTEGENGYTRQTENFCETAYTEAQIEKAIKSAGLSLIAVYDGDSFGNLQKDSQRILFVTKRV